MQFGAGVAGPVRQPPRNAHRRHSEIPAVFLNQKIGRGFRRAKEVNASSGRCSSTRESRLRTHGRVRFPIVSPIRATANDSACRHKPCSSIKIQMALPDRNSALLPANSACRWRSREIGLRIARGPIVRRLRCAVYDRADVCTVFLE